MRRRDEWREIVAEWRGEIRAGWHDARRTPSARPWHGDGPYRAPLCRRHADILPARIWPDRVLGEVPA